jgi:CARDB
MLFSRNFGVSRAFTARMRRALITAALAAAALAAAASAAPPQASVKVVECSVEQHEAAFYARMHRVTGTSRMAMRFTLLEETGGDTASPVTGPGLGRWHHSKPGVQAFGYRQGYRKLPENASHRVRVAFRWYASDGSLVAHARRRSARCRQFVGLPNLETRLTGVTPAKTSGVVRYDAVVMNTGRAAASGVPVRLTVDGNVVDTVTIPSVARGERRALAIRGPECMRTVRIEADPERAIAESSDADNASELTCAALRKIG